MVFLLFPYVDTKNRRPSNWSGAAFGFKSSLRRGARTYDDDAMPTTVKDAIKAFEAAKECVAAEAEKVRARDFQASPHPRGSSHRTVHTRFPHASFRAVA